MTTSTQQTVLSTEEIQALRACADGNAVPAEAREALAAKGMLAGGDDAACLTPAGRHALDVHTPGSVPGIDT
ncbi:hypothetical protein GCM10028862_19160 [Luteimonas pelagia]